MRKVCEELEFAGNNCKFTTDNTVNNMCAWALLSRAALFKGTWQKYHATYISKSLVGNNEMILFKVYSHTAESGKVIHAHAMQGWPNSS
ncbi:MAG: hypothetical protein RR555_02870 [Bacteroidales bacterium]